MLTTIFIFFANLNLTLRFQFYLLFCHFFFDLLYFSGPLLSALRHFVGPGILLVHLVDQLLLDPVLLCTLSRDEMTPLNQAESVHRGRADRT